MTLWTPDWRIKVNGTELTSVTLSNLTITSGRQDINSPTPAGYCSLEVINTDGTNYSFTINTAVTVEIKDTSGNYVAIFGGRVSDLRQILRSAGSRAVITSLRITAIGALSNATCCDGLSFPSNRPPPFGIHHQSGTYRWGYYARQKRSGFRG